MALGLVLGLGVRLVHYLVVAGSYRGVFADTPSLQLSGGAAY